MKTITYTQTLLRAHLPKPKTDPRVKTIQKKKNNQCVFLKLSHCPGWQ